ncbi:hypothetical protein ACKVCA_26395 (plasmid) [Escherichia coli]
MFLLVPMLNVVIAEVKRFNCPLLFVKDHGVYVMAAKGEKNSNGMHNVCYAGDAANLLI